MAKEWCEEVVVRREEEVVYESEEAVEDRDRG